MADGPPSPKRMHFDREQLESLSKEELIKRWFEREDTQENATSKHEGTTLEDGDAEKWKAQYFEASRRENILVKRLAGKEQEIQEIVNQLQEMKAAQAPSNAQLRAMLLDPAVNLLFHHMNAEMGGCKERLEQAQNDLAAWKFTPDSQTGKRLMSKCRLLLQENEELGKVISAGRTAKLEGEIALEKTLVQEMKKSQAEMDEFVVELDEDVEGMQSTIYFLQQQLKEAKDQIGELQLDNDTLRALPHAHTHTRTRTPTPPLAHTQTNTEKSADTVMDSQPASPPDSGIHAWNRQASAQPDNQSAPGAGGELDMAAEKAVENVGGVKSETELVESSKPE